MTLYDQIPYRSRPNPYSHPANLTMVATLLGLPPPPLAGARVLELGCGTGSNLIPMAEDLTDTELCGIDLSARQIALCQEQAAALGLKNVSFRQMDLMDLPPDLGAFDYIIAHGLYSWVPPPVRDRAMALCGRHLTERGLAYVSYNTQPGWRVTGVVRDLLRFHLRGLSNPEQQSAALDQALDLLIDGVTERSGTAPRFLQDYARRYKAHLAELGAVRGPALHHDILAEVNDPVYFRDFAAHAGQHGLAFLSEAPFALSLPSDLPEAVRATIFDSVESEVDVEQYADFLQMRTFRQTVLCRQGAPINRTLRPENLIRLHARASIRPASAQQDLQGSRVEKFTGPEGSTMGTNHPVSKAALLHLSEIWPASVSFPELLRVAREHLGAPATGEELVADAAGTSADAQELGRNLLRAFCNRRDMVTLRGDAPKVALAVAERPVARPLSRREAAGGTLVTNLYHEAVELTPLQRWVLPHLDGTRDRAALLQTLVDLAERGDMAVEREGSKVTDPLQLRRALGGDLDTSLQRLQQYALLTG